MMVSCRLKDIQNLFMDTGVSTDSYAIIELGMVDDIIKDKDNSRRRMLEQAAGVTIYKTRKRKPGRSWMLPNRIWHGSRTFCSRSTIS